LATPGSLFFLAVAEAGKDVDCTLRSHDDEVRLLPSTAKLSTDRSTDKTSSKGGIELSLTGLRFLKLFIVFDGLRESSGVEATFSFSWGNTRSLAFAFEFVFLGLLSFCEFLDFNEVDSAITFFELSSVDWLDSRRNEGKLFLLGVFFSFLADSQPETGVVSDGPLFTTFLFGLGMSDERRLLDFLARHVASRAFL